MKDEKPMCVMATLNTMPYMLRVKDIKKIMGIGRRAAYEFVRNHECMIKVGKQMFIPKPQFEQWLIKNRNEKIEKNNESSSAEKAANDLYYMECEHK